MKRNYILYKFFTRYAAWLDAGAPEDAPFSTSAGLCANLRMFASRYGYAQEVQAFTALAAMLAYPFGGRGTYYKEMLQDRMHLNPQRIAFVYKEIGRG